MTSPSTAPTLVERTEIHKSCKSVEMLLNILNEYCEAAGAVVVLQKKLSKALKDAANAKVTGEIACESPSLLVLHTHGCVYVSKYHASQREHIRVLIRRKLKVFEDC
jgi:hypothetical protein